VLLQQLLTQNPATPTRGVGHLSTIRSAIVLAPGSDIQNRFGRGLSPVSPSSFALAISYLSGVSATAEQHKMDLAGQLSGIRQLRARDEMRAIST
jgi:hypothetical protein